MRSKKLNLNPYLKKINEIKEKQTSELIRLQTEDYVDFVSELINLANIMKKTFYAVVPYDPVTIKSSSIIDKLFRKNSEPSGMKISSQEFNRYKQELAERANVVASGLGGMGLHCVQLNTEEIIELFYKIYNPDIADKERFSDVEDLTGEVVANISEKKDEKKEEEEIAGETVIDNSSIVEEQKKKEVQAKEMEADNKAQRQITGTEAAAPKASGNISLPPQNTPATASAPNLNVSQQATTSSAPPPQSGIQKDIATASTVSSNPQSANKSNSNPVSPPPASPPA